jgi:hypothetical protein
MDGRYTSPPNRLGALALRDSPPQEHQRVHQHSMAGTNTKPGEFTDRQDTPPPRPHSIPDPRIFSGDCNMEINMETRRKSRRQRFSPTHARAKPTPAQAHTAIISRTETPPLVSTNERLACIFHSDHSPSSSSGVSSGFHGSASWSPSDAQ